MQDLTDKQRQVLRFIEERVSETGGPPTIREIAEEIGATSTTAPRRHLEALERKGHIERRSVVARGIVLTRPREEPGLPVVGRVAAGAPVLAEQNIEEYLNVGDAFDHVSGTRFALRVVGDSMIDAQICDGDYVIVRCQEQVESGEIGVALIDGEATVKRIHQDGFLLRLVPANAAMAPMEFDLREEAVSVVGRVVGVVRRL